MDEYERCVRIWKNWVRSAPDEISMRLQNYQLNQSYHSVKLEYPSVAIGQVNSIWTSGRLIGFTGDLYSVVAINNHKVAHALSEDCLAVQEPLSVDLICGLQHALSCGLYTPEDYVVHEERPGEFKQFDQVEGLVDVGSSPEDIEDALISLVSEMPHIADMNDTLVAAAYLQARLLFLRPFAVANGFVSRMITNYWLRLHSHPPIVINGTEAVRYRECLEAFDVQEDIEPLALFLCEQLTDFWSDQMLEKEPQRKQSFRLRF